MAAMNGNEVLHYTVSDAGGGGIIRLIINGIEYQLTANQAYALGKQLVEWGRPMSSTDEEPYPEMPPLGLMPRSIAIDMYHTERRAQIADAIRRYLDAGMLIPREWWQEYDDVSRALGYRSGQEVDQ